jgi:predicted permease
MGLAGLVLAAACANVANVLFARGLSRRKELALRIALGASRRRIVGQLLLESLGLAVAGAGLGLALAYVGRQLLPALRPLGRSPAVFALPFDAHVIGFVVAVTMGVTLAVGLMPALRATRLNLSAQFSGGSRLLGGGRSRASRMLMIVQVALAMVLLVSTALFVRTMRHLSGIDAGFDRSGLVLFGIDATSAGYDRDRALDLQRRLLTRLERVPGVRGATYSSVPLLSGVRQNRDVVVPGHMRPAGASPFVDTNGLAPNFFDVMRLPIVEGRGFTEGDIDGAALVAVVNPAFARTYLGEGGALGRIIRVGSSPGDQVQIVGVARDAQYTQLRGNAPPTIYLPAWQQIDGQANFAVRVVAGDDAGIARVERDIRSAVADIDRTLPLVDLRTQVEQIDRLEAEPLLMARLSAIFGGVVLVLAAIGLYGLFSHVMTQRTGEIGLRMAVGASPAIVLGGVLREVLGLLLIAIAVGAILAYAAGRFVATLLYGLTTMDPASYGAAAVVIALAGLAAGFVPARRASRIDPVAALRSE